MKEVLDVIPKDDVKNICLDFFYWWYNQPGNNTEEGFEKWYKEKTL